MEKEETLDNFVRTIILLVNVKNLLKDDFFAGKLDIKIYSLSSAFFNLSLERELGHVAQYEIQKEKCFGILDSLADVVKEIEYLALVEDTSLLLEAERNLLALRLEVIKSSKDLFVIKKEKIEPEESSAEEKIQFYKPASEKNENSKMTPNKKKILEFIKSYPNKRTKDIIFEFNVLSNRTVKRNLTDLLRSGLVRKKIDNKAVYYYASE